MTIHSKTFIHFFSFALLVLGFCLAMQSAGIVWVAMLGAVSCFISIVLFISNLYFADFHDCMNAAKSHSARILKNDSGEYVLEICRFPFIYSDAFFSEENAESEYAGILKSDKRAAVARKEAGLVKVLASPKKSEKSKRSIQDDIEHIKQVARESGVNMDAFDKIEEILSKTYKDEPPAVLKIAPHAVTFKKNEKTFTRSRRGFVKEYGEPVLSKLAPEPAKKRSQKRLDAKQKLDKVSR